MNSKKQQAPIVRYSKRAVASNAEYSTEVTGSQLAKLEESFQEEFSKHEWEEESARAW